MSSRAIFLLIAAAIAWILAVKTGEGLAFSMAYLLSGILILSYLWARSSTRAVHIQRFTRSRRSHVGQFAEEHFDVSNRGWLPKLWLEVQDFSTLPWHSEASRVINGLGRGRTYRWQVRTLCTQRGRFRLGPMRLRSSDPLGTFNVEQELANSTYIVVFPQTIELTSFNPSISDLAGGEAQHRRAYEVTTNAAGVRDYMPGDSLNRIHWPTTVRMRRLMTKEFDLDPTSDIWIYLDLHRGTEVSAPWIASPPEIGLFAMGKRTRSRSQFQLPPITTEYGVTIAASLARYFLMRNRSVGMSSWGKTREYLQVDQGERQLNKMLEALAVVEAAGEFPFAHLIATDGMRLNRNDTVLAISADPNPEWAQALQLIQRRGINSTAVIIDSGTFGSGADYVPLLAGLESAGIVSYRVARDVPIDEALAHSVSSALAR
jgi:uncharacterized protein (DUF58 family)